MEQAMDYPNKNDKHFISQSPAQYVILDVGIPTPANITANVLTAIQNVLCLGNDHVPVIGVALINSVFDQVVGLCSTNTQLRKILQALNTVKNTVSFRARISMEEFQDNIYIGVKRALENFQSLPHKLEDNQVCPIELQVMILSMKNGSEIQYYIQQLLTALPTEPLKKIQVIELVQDYMEVEANKSCSGVQTVIECVRLPGSLEKLDELMKQWLLRGPMAQEDVRIVLHDCVVLCDFQQCLIRPGLDTATRHPTIPDPTESLKLETDTLHLEVTHRLVSAGICETEMCGDPVILLPSQSYQLTWDEKQVNQQYYLTVIEKLMMTKEYLVAKLEVEGKLLNYFILMPGEDFILMRTLVSAEVVMPFPGTLTYEVDQEIDNITTEALLAVPTLKAYNPADFSTSLHKTLYEAALQPTRVTSQRVPSRTDKTITNTQEPLCKDPSHRSMVVDIEIKKTVKRRKCSRAKLRKKTSSDLPKLSLADQQTLTDFFARKKKNNLHYNNSNLNHNLKMND